MRLYATQDGGATWSKLPSTTVEVSNLTLVSPGVAWAIFWTDYGEQVRETVDGGGSWRTTALPPADYLSGPVFGDPEHGMVAETFAGSDGSLSDSRLYVTADGGATWQASIEVDPSASVVAPDPSDWLVVEPGSVQSSHDSGQTWERQDTTGLPSYAGAESFADAEHGWAPPQGSVCLGCFGAFQLGGPYYGTELDATDDGGRTWHSLDTFPKAP
jgi:photosystem II stability/assembly factor-like uncharacterized protein